MSFLWTSLCSVLITRMTMTNFYFFLELILPICTLKDGTLLNEKKYSIITINGVTYKSLATRHIVANGKSVFSPSFSFTEYIQESTVLSFSFCIPHCTWYTLTMLPVIRTQWHAFTQIHVRVHIYRKQNIYTLSKCNQRHF